MRWGGVEEGGRNGGEGKERLQARGWGKEKVNFLAVFDTLLCCNNIILREQEWLPV